LKTDQQKILAQFRAQLDATALVFRSYASVYSYSLFPLALPIHANRGRNFSRFLLSPTMARVGSPRNLASPAKKRRNNGESAQLLNN
jgi:hypothetical protein